MLLLLHNISIAAAAAVVAISHLWKNMAGPISHSTTTLFHMHLPKQKRKPNENLIAIQASPAFLLLSHPSFNLAYFWLLLHTIYQCILH
jgi:hypothetical protein